MNHFNTMYHEVTTVYGLVGLYMYLKYETYVENYPFIVPPNTCMMM